MPDSLATKATYTEHSFRVRTVRGSEVSEWSDVVMARTQKASFEASGWKECLIMLM